MPRRGALLRRGSRRPIAMRACGILTALVLAVPASEAPAIGTGTTTTSSALGITLVVSCLWVDGAGYRPVQVAIYPTTPLAADQTLHLEFHSQIGDREILVSKDFELPAGSPGIADTVAVPQLFPLQMVNVEVWLNGKYSSKLSQRGFAGGAGHAEGMPNVLVIQPPPPAVTTAPTPISNVLSNMLVDPDSSTLVSVFPPDAGRQQWGGFGAVATPAGSTKPSLPTILTVPFDRLPRRWIELTSIDLACISLKDLKQLAALEPERHAALRQWLYSGGNIIVFNVGPARSRADDAARLLAPNASLENSFVDGRWTEPARADFSDRLKGYSGNYGISTASVGQPPESAPFALRRIGEGVLLAADTGDLFAQGAQDWIWMLNSIGSDRWLWYRRHGLSLNRKNGDFWTWLVHGVGLAPVSEFRILITIFVLAIGPLNYFWLRRRGRLHLLVIVVPVAACAVTLGLFGYAILADGLDVRVRARSFTQLDQRSGQAVCWSRISYYAGLAPSGGLIFPEDTAVLPLTANEGDTSDMPRRQTILWSTGRQELVSGWLASRTATQFMTVRSRISPAMLRFVPSSAASPPQVENQLGSRIIRLLLTDDAGDPYRASDVAAGARVALEPIADAAVEQTALEAMVAAHQPAVPQGFVQPAAYGYRGRRRYVWYSGVNNALPPPSLAGSVLETKLRAAVNGDMQDRRAQGSDRVWMLERHYLAIVERSPEVALGVDAPREEDSLHVIVGSW